MKNKEATVVTAEELSDGTDGDELAVESIMEMLGW